MGHDFVTELLRLNILTEYGGVFQQMKMYHAEIFDVGVPCDFEMLNQRESRELTQENSPTYSLFIPLEIAVNCDRDSVDIFGNEGINNRIFRGRQQSGTQTASSDLLSIEVRLADEQTIAGNFEKDSYTYGHSGLRSILITKGISAELDPTASLNLFFPNGRFDQDIVEWTDTLLVATFRLSIITNSWPNYKKSFEGTIQLIDDAWTLTYDDGEVRVL